MEKARKKRFWAVYITITIEAVLDNLPDGKKLRDGHTDGHLVIKRFYKNNLANGTCTHFFDDGSVAEKFEYLNGNYSRTYREYYRDGSIRKEITFLKSGKHHCYKFWYDEGKSDIRDKHSTFKDIFPDEIFINMPAFSYIDLQFNENGLKSVIEVK